MSNEQHSLREQLASLTEEHARAFDAAIGDASYSPTPEFGGYFADLKARAAESGTDPDQLFAQDQNAFVHAGFPTPACLKPDDVAFAAVGQIAALHASTQAHLLHCPYCQAVVALTNPPASAVAELSRRLANPVEQVMRPLPRWVTALGLGIAAVVRGSATVATPIVAIVVTLLAVSSNARLRVSNLLARPTVMDPLEENQLLSAVRSTLEDKHTDAIAKTNDVLKIDGRNTDALLMRANAHLSLGMYSAGAKDLDAVKQIDPQSAVANHLETKYMAQLRTPSADFPPRNDFATGSGSK